MTPKVEINIGQSSIDTKVFIDGVDVSRALSRVLIDSQAGQPTAIELHVSKFRADVRLAGPMRAISVLLDPIDGNG